MRAPKATICNRDKVLLGFGGLSIAPVCFFIFLGTALVPSLVFGIAAVLAAILSVCLFPILYAKIGSSVAVAVGKYHVPLAFTALLGAGVTAFAASAYRWFSETTASVLFLIGFPIGVLCALIFFSVSASIQKRMTVKGDKLFAAIRIVTSILGAALPFLALFFSGMFEGPEFTVNGLQEPVITKSAAISAVGQLSAILFLLGGMAVYFSSAPYMPRFIRLEESEKRLVKEQYRIFYGSLGGKKGIMNSLSVLFSGTAVLSILFILVRIKHVTGADIAEINFSETFNALAFCFYYVTALFITGYFAGVKITSQKNQFVCMLIAALMILLAGTGMIILRTVRAGGWLYAALPLLGFGAGLGLAVWAYRGEVLVSAGKTAEGSYRNYRNILITCAFALCAVLCIAENFAGSLVIYISAIAASVLAVVFAILSREKTDSLTLRGVDDFVTMEIMQDIQGGEEGT